MGKKTPKIEKQFLPVLHNGCHLRKMDPEAKMPIISLSKSFCKVF